MMTEPSFKWGQGQHPALGWKGFGCMTYDAQRASQPAKKCEFLVEEDGGEDGGDDDG